MKGRRCCRLQTIKCGWCNMVQNYSTWCIIVQEYEVQHRCRLQTIKCGRRGLTSWRPVCCPPSSASNSTLPMWTVITVHSLNVHFQLSIMCNVNITVCTWRVKQADAPRDTSEGKSHGSWDPEVPPPSLSGSILRHGEAKAGRGDFDEARAGSDRTRGQWGSFPWSPLIISPRKGHKMDIFAIIIPVNAPFKTQSFNYSLPIRG